MVFPPFRPYLRYLACSPSLAPISCSLRKHTSISCDAVLSPSVAIGCCETARIASSIASCRRFLSQVQVGAASQQPSLPCCCCHGCCFGVGMALFICAAFGCTGAIVAYSTCPGFNSLALMQPFRRFFVAGSRRSSSAPARALARERARARAPATARCVAHPSDSLA